MDPEIWGPKAWFFLHTITFNYPEHPSENDKQIYKSFFNSLTDVLPCKVCANHYKENILNNPIDDHLDNKDNLVKWLIHLHNEVNESNSKATMNYDEVMNYYREQYNISEKIDINEPISTRKNAWLYILLIICIIQFIYIICSKM
jgi:hypothetical protein